MSSRAFARVVRCISKQPPLRTRQELLHLEPWFRKKSQLFNKVSQETLLDVIQHCEFVSCQADDVIIHQGEKGHRFYIVLRGTVSVFHKDSLEDVDLGAEGKPRHVDKSTLGNVLVTLGEGTTFGEIALINPDCVRTASVVANELTDLVVIHRDLYDRSVARVVAREFEERTNFVETHPLLSSWAPRWRKALAASLRKETFAFDTPLFRQGDGVDNMYFITSGEVKLSVDPEAHYHQFNKYMSCCNEILDDDTEDSDHEQAYFPLKLMPQLRKFSRIRKVTALSRPSSGVDRTIQFPRSWTPSSIRKMNARIQAKRVSLSLCYLGSNQYVGEVEFLLALDVYHATAVCSQATVVMAIHRIHFERLFRRRNLRTVRQMARTAELQLARRALHPHILSSVPLFKCFMYRLQQLNGPHRPFAIPEMTYVTTASRATNDTTASAALVVKPTTTIQPPHYAFDVTSEPTLASMSRLGSRASSVNSVVYETPTAQQELETGMRRLSPHDDGAVTSRRTSAVTSRPTSSARLSAKSTSLEGPHCAG